MTQRTKARGESTSDTSRNGESEIAADAFIFGYPLVIMDATCQLATAVPRVTLTRAPLNQFLHLRSFPDATFTDVVTPNADTLYSTAWLDLSAEPMVLGVPDIADRYYLMQMLDAWTNVFADPGTRTTGNKKGAFAIVGPKWSGALPPRLTTIYAPTNLAWLIGRTQTNGKSDYSAVNAIQNEYSLTPLSQWGKLRVAAGDVPVKPGIDATTPPAMQVAKMDAVAFFRRLNALMSTNPASAADAPALARFASIGIGAGRAIDAAGLDPAIEAGYKVGQATLVDDARKPHGTRVNGWEIPPGNTGRFGTDYAGRAAVALLGLGANIPDDAVYPHTTVDSSGAPLNGANKYVIRVPKGGVPPVKAFWSLTMYNAKQAFVDNPIHRYTIGDRDPLMFAEDGSVTLYIQHGSPDKSHEPNWLPAPADDFNLVLRLYWPGTNILNGSWQPPGVDRVSSIG